MSNPIPDAVIESVKSHTSLVSLLSGYNIPVKKSGKGYKAICPFHQVDGKPEGEPSLSIDTVKNVYYCFSCAATGNAIQLVMEMDRINFPEAVNKLLAVKEPVPAVIINENEKAAKEEEQEPSTVELPDSERRIVLKEIVRESVTTLRNNKAGREYLESRGLNPLELLNQYQIGFWNGNQYPKLAEEEKKKLSSIGLINGRKSLFENCVLFPLTKDNHVTTIYGRKAVSGNGSHYMLPCRREGLYLPASGLNPQKPVVITESIIDSLSLFAAGITNVLPLLGVNGFLPDHLACLKQNSFPRIYLALDGDEAGNRGAAQLQCILREKGLSSYIIQLPENKDVNDMLREMGPKKLKQWFVERIQQNTNTAKPTVWEDDDYLYMLFGSREYRIKLNNPTSLDTMKVNVKTYEVESRNNFHVDTLDLYQNRSRSTFISQLSRMFDLEREQATEEINSMITILEEQRIELRRTHARGKTYQMSEDERAEALAYLKAPNLLDRIANDFKACGMVGNRNNNLLAYLGNLSRLTDRPFGTLIVSRSGAGKSFLQDMVSSMTPDESLLSMTRLTGQSLFYQGRNGLKHKLLSIEEDEGMQEAMYSIRTLLSSQKLCLHGVKTDQRNGELTSFQNVVEGPASVLISTTNLAAFNHESVNRFFVLFLDESREQTSAILAHQHSMSGKGKIREKIERDRITQLHRNIQRLLKPITVINRIGTGINYPPEILNTRRENTKAEALIETITLLHQYQRKMHKDQFFGVTTTYIEVEQVDIDAVHTIAGEVLRQSLDTMSKLCRELLEHIHELVNTRYQEETRKSPHIKYWEITFTRKELMERCRWSRFHLEEHLCELVEEGYIVQKMGKKGQRYAYSLVDETIPELLKV